MRTILIQNFHPSNTAALICDFAMLGYTILMPKDNWGGKIGYFSDNSPAIELANQQLLTKPLEIHLISFEEYMANYEPADVLLGCFEQWQDLYQIALEHGDRTILHTAQNDMPYPPSISDHFISPDIITYEKYQARKKMMYFYPGIVSQDFRNKDFAASYKSNVFGAYNHFYEQYWLEGFKAFKEFQDRLHVRIPYFGEGNPDGQRSREFVHDLMQRSWFTVYFKDRDCYGNAVLESMLLGTPVVALRRLIAGKTLGTYFLDDSTAILGDSVPEIIEKMQKQTLEEYTAMCNLARTRVLELTDTPKRLAQMREVLELDIYADEKGNL